MTTGRELATSPAPVDSIRITPRGFELYLDPKGLTPKAIKAIKRGTLDRLLGSLFQELWGGIRAGLRELPKEIQETSLDTVIAGEWEKLQSRYLKIIGDFAEQYEVPGERLPLPISPPVRVTLQAIMNQPLKGGGWGISQEGTPHYTYTKQDDRITITFEAPPEAEDALRAIWEAASGLSVETAIVLCILLERIARLRDPREIAVITWKDIAEMRGVGLRGGRVGRLREATQDEILRLAMLRLSMVWRDRRTGGTITFGTKELPDRIIDLVEIQYEKDGKTGSAFSIRAGQALSYFLTKEEGGRWIGYFSRALFQVDPYREALVWKLGVYWTFTGMVAQKKGGYAAARPETILAAIGEAPDSRGRIIERFTKAHKRLVELRVLSGLPEGIEPQGRGRERLQKWRQTSIEAKLHPDLWKLNLKPRLIGYAPETTNSPIVAENSPIVAENSTNT